MEFLQADTVVQMAARVAKTFSIDPIVILRDSEDPLVNQVRMAAAYVVQEDERKAAEQSKAGGRRPRK